MAAVHNFDQRILENQEFFERFFVTPCLDRDSFMSKLKFSESEDGSRLRSFVAQFIDGCDVQKISVLLQFLTGASTLPTRTVLIQYNQNEDVTGFDVSTCTFCLKVPRAIRDYEKFEFDLKHCMVGKGFTIV